MTMEGPNMRRMAKGATWFFLASMAALAGIHGPGCAAAEDPDRNGENPAIKGQCTAADDDGDPCTAEGCKGSSEEHVIVAGLPCGSNGALECDAKGQCVGCLTSAACGEAEECKGWSCNAGVCARSFATPGTPVSAQTPGDCMQVQCNGQGGEMDGYDDTDVPSKSCFIGSCAGGEQVFTPAPVGTECSVDGGKHCNSEGACVECTKQEDCPADVQTFCAPNGTCHKCNDGVQNGDETDVDCGGAGCSPCKLTQGCAVNKDCQSKFCADEICCNSACTSACEACNNPESLGECTLSPKYGEDASYGNGLSCLNQDKLACTGGGACKQALGTTCVNPGDCASLRCADITGSGTKTCLKAPGDACAQNAECFNNKCTGGACSP
jgi:hypothetical protein